MHYELHALMIPRRERREAERDLLSTPGESEASPPKTEAPTVQYGGPDRRPGGLVSPIKVLRTPLRDADLANGRCCGARRVRRSGLAGGVVVGA